MKKLSYILVYSFLIAINFIFISKFFVKEEKKDLLEYKVIDVVKIDKQVHLIAELNNHYYVIHKSFDNVIFKHYTECPYCRKKFIPFVFSVYDSFNLKLQEKYKNLLTFDR